MNNNHLKVHYNELFSIKLVIIKKLAYNDIKNNLYNLMSGSLGLISFQAFI